MNGAILGDLAAWTWEQDKDLFFRKLVSSEASPSKMMKEMLLMADTLAQVRGSDIKVHESLGMRISLRLPCCAPLQLDGSMIQRLP